MGFWSDLFGNASVDPVQEKSDGSTIPEIKKDVKYITPASKLRSDYKSKLVEMKNRVTDYNSTTLYFNPENGCNYIVGDEYSSYNETERIELKLYKIVDNYVNHIYSSRITEYDKYPKSKIETLINMRQSTFHDLVAEYKTLSSDKEKLEFLFSILKSDIIKLDFLDDSIPTNVLMLGRYLIMNYRDDVTDYHGRFIRHRKTFDFVIDIQDECVVDSTNLFGKVAKNFDLIKLLIITKMIEMNIDNAIGIEVSDSEYKSKYLHIKTKHDFIVMKEKHDRYKKYIDCVLAYRDMLNHVLQLNGVNEVPKLDTYDKFIMFDGMKDSYSTISSYTFDKIDFDPTGDDFKLYLITYLTSINS